MFINPFWNHPRYLLVTSFITTFFSPSVELVPRARTSLKKWCGLKNVTNVRFFSISSMPLVQTHWHWSLWRPRKVAMLWMTFSMPRATPPHVSTAIVARVTARLLCTTSSLLGLPFWWLQQWVASRAFWYHSQGCIQRGCCDSPPPPRKKKNPYTTLIVV